MQAAIIEAKKALTFNEVPIGCIIVYNNEIITRNHNLVVTTNDPTAHAEMLAIKQATAMLSTRYLNGCDMYVTLEPCVMCTAAISIARVGRLYCGALDNKGGGVYHGPKLFYNENSNLHHTTDCYNGFCETECSAMLNDFFAKLR